MNGGCLGPACKQAVRAPVFFGRAVGADALSKWYAHWGWSYVWQFPCHFRRFRAAAKRSAEQFPRASAAASGGGLGAVAPINTVSNCVCAHGSCRWVFKGRAATGRSQSKRRISTVPNSDVEGALAPVMKSKSHAGLGVETNPVRQSGLADRPQQSVMS